MAAKSEILSGVDNAWLRMERPTNLMMITGVMIFSDPLSYEQVVRVVSERFLRYDRFRQRVVHSRLPMRPSRWVVDRNFDLRAHIHRMSLPTPGDQSALEEVVSNLMSTPLDYTKPLWQFHLIENYNGGSVLLGRLHHSIADGIALMRVMLSMTDNSPEPEIANEHQGRRAHGGGLATMAGSARVALNQAQSFVEDGLQALGDRERLTRLAGLGVSGATSLGKLVLRWPDPGTIFKGELGVIKKAAWSQPLSLQDVKAVGKVTGGTINDVLLTAMTGALRRYMLARRQPVDGVNFRALVPVNLRPLDGPIELGNKFGLVFLSLPVGIGDPLERLVELKRRMDALKESPEAYVVLGLLDIFGRVPGQLEELALDIFGTKATGVMTNVPGPREPIYFGGSKMDSLMFWVPQSGQLGLGVSIISYADRVWLGVSTDAGLVPDPQRIISSFHEEFAELMELVHTVEGSNGAGPAPSGKAMAESKTATASKSAAAGDAAPVISVEELPAPPLPYMTQRCHAVTLTGTQCRNRAQPGSDFCRMHMQATEELPGS